jgi:hypothetical protein
MKDAPNGRAEPSVDQPNSTAKIADLRQAWKAQAHLATDEIHRIITETGVMTDHVEDCAGMARGDLDQLLDRKTDLNLEDVLVVVAALGEDAGSFFGRIYSGQHGGCRIQP